MENTYIFILVAIIVFMFFGSIIFYGLENYKRIKANLKKRKWWKIKTWRKICLFCWVLSALLTLGLLIVLFARASSGYPAWNLETQEWAHFGTFIGAILLAATLFFQIRTSRRQQIESNLFEMVRYYRANLTEMRFRNPFYYELKDRKSGDEYVEGRQVIKTIFEQYKVALKVVYCVLKDEIAMTEIKNCDEITKETRATNKLKLLSNLAYQIVYWGTPYHITNELEAHLKEEYSKFLHCRDNLIPSELKSIDRIISAAQQIIAVYECKGRSQAYSAGLKISSKPIIDCKKSEKKIKFFGGHQYHLSHYFRHYYRTINYIDKQPSWLISRILKGEYIDILRAQTSNYEQALLFLNSLSCIGVDWEYEGNNSFISDYNIIRNLPKHFIPIPFTCPKETEKSEKEESVKEEKKSSVFINPRWYYPEVDFEWENKNWYFKETQTNK